MVRIASCFGLSFSSDYTVTVTPRVFSDSHAFQCTRPTPVAHADSGASGSATAWSVSSNAGRGATAWVADSTPKFGKSVHGTATDAATGTWLGLATFAPSTSTTSCWGYCSKGCK